MTGAGLAGAVDVEEGADSSCLAGEGLGGEAEAVAASTTISNEPLDTLSPSWTLTSVTWPAIVEGTSMLALSDSKVIIGSST